MSLASIIISSIALLISVATFWLTRVRRGSIKMTKPTIICFVPKNGGDNPKVFLRTLLYNTSDRGQYVQNIFIQLLKNRSIKNFNVWAYGDKGKGLVRGSGLFVDKTGVEEYHHFLLPTWENDYIFSPGEYTITVFVETVNETPKKIFEHKLTLDDSENVNRAAIYFDWESDRQNYYPHPDIGRGLPNLT